MSLLHDEPLLTIEESGDSGEVPIPPAPPRERGRSKRWWIVGLVLAAFLLGGGLWWLLDSTVPASDHDDAIADRDAAEAALAESEATLAESEQALADSNASLSNAERALAGSRTELSKAEDEIAAIGTELTGVQETVAAYEEGITEFWAMALSEGAGFDREIAHCVAEEMVARDGPATVEVFSDLALAGSGAMPSMQFMGGLMGAMDACGLDANDFGPAVSAELLQQLRTECAAGSGSACDDLYYASSMGSEDELFGATCGERFTIEEAPAFCAGNM